MAKHDIYCKCNSCRRRRSILGDTQTETNRTLVVPSSAKSDYQLAVESGFFEGTLEEWLNRPVNTSLEVTEYGENV